MDGFAATTTVRKHRSAGESIIRLYSFAHSRCALAFIMGVVPLVFATGAGTVFTGMWAVTLFGLLLTPVLYGLVRSARQPQITAAQSVSKPVY